MPEREKGRTPTGGVIEFLKYTLVGIGSTVIQYGVYSLCYYLTENYVFSNVAAFLLYVLNSFYWNRRIVFHSKETTTWWIVLLKNYALYFTTGVVATNLLSFLLIDCLGVSPYLSPIIIVVILYPINYLINKFWAHKRWGRR